MAVSRSVHKPNIDNVIDENNPFFGYVRTLERALEIVRDYELKTTTKFTVYKKRRTLELLESSRAQNMQTVFKFSHEMSNYVLFSNW